MREVSIYDVAIIGYGPVGATFANLLAKHGLKIAVVEQAPDIYDKPRAITIDHEVLRVFQACGLGEVMAKGIAPHPGTHYLGVDREVIKIFDPMPQPYPLGWVPTATFVQPDAERALRGRLSEYGGANVFLSTRAVDLAQDERGVALTIEREGTVSTLRAQYLVACDGANSFVRKQLGIELDDLAFDEWWMVVDALTDDLTKRPHKCFQYCWPSRPGTFLPGPGALRRWEIKLLPGETPEDFASSDRILSALSAFTDTSDLTIWRSAVYRFHALVAQKWRSGRIFLMGDAVHQTPPFLGQGLCAGIRDAFNLAWKLAFVLKSRGGDALLDSYEIERKPHVSAVIGAAKEFGKIIGELDEVAARARDAKLRAELAAGTAETIRQRYIPNLKSGVIAANAMLAGSLFVQPNVAGFDGEIVRLDDLLPLGFTMVSSSVEPLDWLSPRSRDAWRQLGGAEVLISDDVPVPAPENVIRVVEQGGLFSDWLNANEISAVIVRPDRYVFASASNPEELNELVRQLSSCLSKG
jgi:3-(3-hydroxy-phenyl)propionate hydroxylase